MISDRPESRHDLLHSTSAGIKKDRASGRSANVSEPQPSDEILRRIAQRAFQLYEQRGREDGHDVEDWLEAEEEIRRDGVLSRASVASSVYED
jgi:DUF2934 family protein